MRRSQAFFVPLAFVLLAQALSPARALAGDASPTVEERARDYARKGEAFFRRGEWKDAEAAYQAAWDLKPGFDIAANLGEAELQLGQYRDAAEHLAHAIEHFPVTGDTSQKAKLQSRLDEARAKVGAVTVGVSVAGAEVTVDSKAVGTSPLDGTRFVEPGHHRVEARRKGYVAAAADLDAAPGSAQSVNLVLTETKGETTGNGAADGGRKALVVVGTVSAVTFAGAGIALLVASAVAGGEASDLAQPGGQSVCFNAPSSSACADLGDALDRRDTFATLGWVGVGVGATLGVATVIYAVASGRGGPPSGTRVRAAPVAGAHGGGLTFVGTW